MKIKQTFIYGIFAVIFALAFTACFSTWEGDEGTLTISLGGGESGRSIANYFPPDDPEIFNRLEYKVTLYGDETTIFFEAKSGDTIKATVAVGWWDVKADAYIKKTDREITEEVFFGYNIDDSIPFATGTKSIFVRVGQNLVTIPMGQFKFTITFNSNGGTHFNTIHLLPGENIGTVVSDYVPEKTGYDCFFEGWYKNYTYLEADKIDGSSEIFITDNITLYAKWGAYEIGDTGPGGGIIFYQSENGFIMTDTGETCHYFEAAPEDCIVGTKISFQWATSGTSSIDTIGKEEIGNGRQNTNFIIDVEGQGTTYAAQVCVALTTGGYNDWFLPSYNELYLMYENLYQKGLGDFFSSYYHSSSMINTYSVKSLNFNTGEYYSDWFSNANRVRAIHAF